MDTWEAAKKFSMIALVREQVSDRRHMRNGQPYSAKSVSGPCSGNGCRAGQCDWLASNGEAGKSLPRLDGGRN